MASRHVVQQQNRGEVVPEGVKPKKNMAAGEARNRRALGDIGNLVKDRPGVVDVKPKLLPSRPMTRGFSAQMLANAQAAAAAENNKKVIAVKVEVPKPAQKKVTAKPKPKKEVIELSSDSEEEEEEVEKKKQQANTKKAGDILARKQGPTLTATLTARSKSACGLSNKPPKEQIADIDAADVNNELAVVEYIEDMYNFYKLAENENGVQDYMVSQPEINDRMRAILIDWLIEVHHKFELNPETLYLTVNIVDRFLAKKTTPRKELQLLGMGAMLMASKYEEIWAPEVNDFVCISDRAYTHEQVLIMEKRILGELEWYLTVPTPYVFLVRFIKAAIPDSDMENMVYFLAELGLMNYETITYCPSMIAASAVYAARCTLDKKSPAWTDTLKLHTGFSEPQLMNCAKLLASFHAAAKDHKLKEIYRKYSSTSRGAVALLPPAKNLFWQ